MKKLVLILICFPALVFCQEKIENDNTSKKKSSFNFSKSNKSQSHNRLHWKTYSKTIKHLDSEKDLKEITPFENVPPPPPAPSGYFSPLAAPVVPTEIIEIIEPEIIEIIEDEIEIENEVEDTDTDEYDIEDYYNEEDSDDIYIIVESMPVFPGGELGLMKFIQHNVNYPPEAKANDITGKVYVSYVVNKEGQVTNVKVVRGVDKYLDAEAERVVKLLPYSRAGKQRGKFVNVQYTIPINFSLN